MLLGPLAKSQHRAIERKVTGSNMYEPGHPQCRRNVTMVGLPLAAGRGNSGQESARFPIRGAAESSTGFGEHHDEASVEYVMTVL